MAAEKHVGLVEKEAREDSKRLQREWLRGSHENLKRTSHSRNSKLDRATTDSTHTLWLISLILRAPILPDGPFPLTCDAMILDRYCAGDVVLQRKVPTENSTPRLNKNQACTFNFAMLIPIRCRCHNRTLASSRTFRTFVRSCISHPVIPQWKMFIPRRPA